METITHEGITWVSKSLTKSVGNRFPEEFSTKSPNFAVKSRVSGSDSITRHVTY